MMNAEVDPTTGMLETKFHEAVRDALGLSPFTRQEDIVKEIKRLKRCEAILLEQRQQLKPIPFHG